MAKRQTNRKNAGHSKGKATAQAHAAERMSAEGKRPDEVRTSSSMKHASQSTFAKETPLTGEDRPVDVAAKQQEGPAPSTPGLEPADRSHYNEGQPLSARRESSLKRKQAGSEGTPDRPDHPAKGT